jgi:toxin YhaV
MLQSGHPPNDWSHLLDEVTAEGQRLQRLAAGIAP